MDNARPLPGALRYTRSDLRVFRAGVRMSTRRELANCIRALSMDAVQRANSGTRECRMGMADIAQVLWSDFLKHNPAIRSGSTVTVSCSRTATARCCSTRVLHLTGYPLSLEEIENFRQLGSHTAGPPGARAGDRHRDHHRPARSGARQRGGDGARGAAARAQFNRPGFSVVDHYTYVFCGDGCLMEGVSHEACSFAGTLRARQAHRLL